MNPRRSIQTIDMSKPANPECTERGCTRPARMAVKTSPDTLVSRVYYDEREAPNGSHFLCAEHGKLLMVNLIDTLVMLDNDDEK